MKNIKNNISGVYFIKNKINKKLYIGSSVNIRIRWNDHRRKLNNNKHHSNKLQNAWNKYGEISFIFKIIGIYPRNQIKLIEQKYLNSLKPFYNISLSSSCPMFGRKHSEETRKKLKNRIFIKGKNHHLYGKKWTKETRKNILKSRKISNYKHSEITKEKMRKTAIKIGQGWQLKSFQIKRRKKIIDSNNKIFNSLSEAAKFYKISVQAICDNLKGRSLSTKKGITFKYV